jgi:hypothetical protein
MKRVSESARKTARRAKAPGISLRELDEKLRGAVKVDRPWMKSFGGLRTLRTETARINTLIEEQFERIEAEDLR